MYPPSHEKRRSKRLRKKLRVAEFQELGFPVENKLKGVISFERESELLDEFVFGVIEPAGLEYGGGLEHGYVTNYSISRKVTENDRRMVADWFESCAEFSSVTVGELEDCWYEGQVIYRLERRVMGDQYSGLV